MSILRGSRDRDGEANGAPTLAVSVAGCTVGYRQTNTITVYEVDDDGEWSAASILGQVNPSTELFPKRWLHTASVIEGEVSHTPLNMRGLPGNGKTGGDNDR